MKTLKEEAEEVKAALEQLKESFIEHAEFFIEFFGVCIILNLIMFCIWYLS